MINNIFTLVVIGVLIIGCNSPQKKEIKKQNTKMENTTIVTNLKKNMVIAHRGSTYWTPEETEIAYRWARNIGADYLELDLQLTKDGALVAFHDNDMLRTTNVSAVFPNISKPTINDFTLKELRSLDAGSWFNKKNTNRAKAGFKDLKIMTLKDVLMIAEGYCFKKENGKPVQEIIAGEWTGRYLYEKDPYDTGNRPGLYVETKHPKFNVEQILAKELTAFGWNINTNPKTIATLNGKVAIANSNERIILQSFSPESIQNLEKELPNIPKCFLLWKADFPEDVKISYPKAIAFAKQFHAEIIGPSISGAPNNYDELTDLWMTDLIHDAGLMVHAYSFDTDKQLNEYHNRVDGVFTNRADLALAFYHRKSRKSAKEILEELE